MYVGELGAASWLGVSNPEPKLTITPTVSEPLTVKTPLSQQPVIMDGGIKWFMQQPTTTPATTPTPQPTLTPSLTLPDSSTASVSITTQAPVPATSSPAVSTSTAPFEFQFADDLIPTDADNDAAATAAATEASQNGTASKIPWWLIALAAAWAFL